MFLLLMKVCVACLFHLHSVLPAVDVGIVLGGIGLALASRICIKIGNA